jgi:hypothetical protein
MWPRRKEPEAHSRTAAELRAAAEEHRPDEARIWAHVETRMATGTRPEKEHARSPAPWSRVLMAALATMTVAGAISTAAWQLTERTHIPSPPSPAQPAVPVPAPPSTETTARPSSVPSAQSTTSERDSSGRSPLVVAVGTTGPQSYPYWGQNDVRLKVGRPVDELSVTIRVLRTDRVSATGSWLSLPANDFRISTEAARDAIVYRWTLLPGRTVRPGSYVMAAQYNRGADHDPGEDIFTMRSGSTTATGHF